MAWLARSIANSLKLDDNNEEEDNHTTATTNTDSFNNGTTTDPFLPDSQSSSPSAAHTPRGVKEDISEFTKTLTRQFWGVTSFLAPPPTDPIESDQRLEEMNRPLDPEAEEEDLIAGIRSDFFEIGGKFRSGISKLSSNMAVSEISKMATNLLHFGSEEGSFDAVGVTEDVVAFARDTAMHPETWLDFPLPDDDDDEANFDDFDMSDVQQEHALAVEHLAPRLASLRIELCPRYMSESCFWMIYFVLLHPKLSKEDALLLSTPQILEARAMLSCELQKRNKPIIQPNQSATISSSNNEPINLQPVESPSVQSDSSHAQLESSPPKTSFRETAPSINPITPETEKQPIQISETEKQPIQISETEKQPIQISETEKQPIQISETEKQPIQISETEKQPSQISETEKQPSQISKTEKQAIQISEKEKQPIQISEKEKQPIQSPKPQVIGKSMHSKEPPVASSEASDVDFEDDGDDWLKDEDNPETIATTSGTTKHLEDDEDVSFSDLEEEDEDIVPIN